MLFRSARDIPTTDADVLVCDGFTGNIVLKLSEGVAMSLFKMIKNSLLSSFRSKIGAMLAMPAFKDIKKSMDLYQRQRQQQAHEQIALVAQHLPRLLARERGQAAQKAARRQRGAHCSGPPAARAAQMQQAGDAVMRPAFRIESGEGIFSLLS